MGNGMNAPVPIIDPGQCMKCGFCMATCPVYQIDHVESHVARGRNMLIVLARQGKISTDEAYGRCLDYCLMCGQCVSVCPAKVPSPAIAVQARNEWIEAKGLTFWQRLIYKGILKHRTFMAGIMGLAAILPGVSHRDGKPMRHLADFMSILSGGIAIPRLSRPFVKKRLKPSLKPPSGTPFKGRVAFFPGCGFEFFFANAGETTAQCLAQAGFEVVYPEGHTCCGMAVHNAGDFKTSRLMAEKNIKALSGFDHIVTGCATCGSTLKNYGNWFADDDPLKPAAMEIAARVMDFSEFLITQGLESQKSAITEGTVTYHSPCHLTFHQGTGDYPRQVLNTLEGLKFIEMEDANNCCGLGGTFAIALDHRDISLTIQSKKMASIKETGAHTVVTACPGCMIQLMDGARRHKMDLAVKHISEVIKLSENRTA